MLIQTLDSVQEDLVRWATTGIPRVPTGYRVVDEPAGGGPAPGELLMFIARPGVGKTFWALNVVAKNPHIPTVMVSLEMHSRYILKRLAAIYTGTPTANIEWKLTTEGHSPAVQQTVEAFPRLVMWDEPGVGVDDLHRILDEYRELKQEDPKLVVIDFLELIRSFGATETESVKRIAMELKDFAREQDAVVMVLHQVSRGVAVKERGAKQAFVDEGHRPLTKGNAAHGGEYSADYMVGAYRPALDPALADFQREGMKRDFRLQLLKSRGDGEYSTKGVQHDWDPATGRITELNWDYWRDPTGAPWPGSVGT
ncbi:MAG TPA: DnaB-like helicase C-terminal domain-containing protein [Acidimicrobiia bacterium]